MNCDVRNAHLTFLGDRDSWSRDWSSATASPLGQSPDGRNSWNWRQSQGREARWSARRLSHIANRRFCPTLRRACNAPRFPGQSPTSGLPEDGTGRGQGSARGPHMLWYPTEQATNCRTQLTQSLMTWPILYTKTLLFFIFIRVTSLKVRK